jgi:hypothetical protein
MKSCAFFPVLVALASSLATARAEIKILIDHNEVGNATAGFKFKQVPRPSGDDDASKAKFSIVDGVKDDNSGELEKLHDGKLPGEEDEPAENFFFDAGTDGGRLLVDLGSVIPLRQINTYSWHPRDRGPQLYRLYASDGKAEGFNPRPKKGVKPDACGWKLVASVDTRPKSGDAGGQYGVSISESDGVIGKYQFLLFDISRTEETDDFGNTFYSEIDVVSAEPAAASAEPATPPLVVRSTDNYCEITIDTSGAPNLRDWAEKKLAPVLAEWYPKITTLLASDGYEAPKAFRIAIRPGRGVAATRGTDVTVNSTWLENELNREGVGAILHEEVHVVQHYGGGRRTNPDGQASVRPPGWLVEGIPDYIRWYLYEPQSHGADAVWMKNRRNLNLNYDGMYRITANFLNYAVKKSEQSLITKLNAVCRQGTYNEEVFKTATGKALAELNDEWKEATLKEVAALKAADSASSAAGSPGDAKPSPKPE